jgi:pre-mRNA-splicing factor 38B
MVRDVDNHGIKIWTPFAQGNFGTNQFQSNNKIEEVLFKNIIASEYYQNTLTKLETMDELIDEIYNEVGSCEPWMSGNARGASTAFCILFRVLSIESVCARTIQRMIWHKDSAYIRAIGLLTARFKFSSDLETLEKVFSDEVFLDPEEFAPSSDEKRTTTIGQFAIDLICEQTYFETLFPRVPEVGKRRIIQRISEKLGLKAEAKGCGGIGGERRAKGDGRGRVMSVKESLSVSVGQRAPHLAGAKEKGRSGFDPESLNRGHGYTGGGGGGGGGHNHHKNRPRQYDNNRYNNNNNNNDNNSRRRDDSRDRSRTYNNDNSRDRRERSRNDDDDFDDYRDDAGRHKNNSGASRELPYARELPYKKR